MEQRFVGFIEGWGEPYSYFVKALTDFSARHGGIIWGTHYLPHDASHKRQQGHRVATPVDMLQEITPGWRYEIVPVVDGIQHGIMMVRDVFGQCWFDETECKAGLEHLAMYGKEWNARLACWKDLPKHDVHSEAADAFRQFAQGYSEPTVRAGDRPRRKRSGSWRVS